MATTESRITTRPGNVATSFYKHIFRSVESSRHEPTAHQDLHWNLLSCLALAQEHDVDLLPIKWQPDFEDSPDYKLEGGTAKIEKLRVDVRLSLVFKRVRILNRFKEIDSEGTYEAISKEIAILTHGPIREHPNIIRLEGLCWDVGEEDLYPVLVFERASCADVFAFLNSKESKQLAAEERLKLCADVGKALMVLHASHIVHGDIKPENVLIHCSDDGTYIAKLADFGYSNLFSDNCLHTLPTSRPWNAPETTSFEVTFEQGQLADIYSFAMLCFWVLFQGRSPEEVFSTTGCQLSLKKIYENIDIVEELKHSNRIKQLASQLTSTEPDLKSDVKDRLVTFFEKTLLQAEEAGFPDGSREADISKLLPFLGPSRLVQSISCKSEVKARSPRNSAIEMTDVDSVSEDALHPLFDFQLEVSIFQLSRADYRVRKSIFSELCKQAQSSQCALCAENFMFQLSLCYRLGFGVRKDLHQSAYWLSRSDRDCSVGDYARSSGIEISTEQTVFKPSNAMEPYMKVQLIFLREYLDMSGYHNPRLKALFETNVFPTDYSNEHRRLGFDHLRTAINVCRGELEDTEEELGHRHGVVYNLRDNLVHLLEEIGDFDAAETEQRKLYTLMNTDAEFGPENSITLYHLMGLAKLQQMQGESDLAKQNLEFALKIYTKTIGTDALQTLLAYSNLAEILYDEGDYEKAERYGTIALSGRTALLGEQNLDTLISMNNVGTYWVHQDKLKEAEDLLTRAKAIASRILGITNSFTLMITNNLAAALSFLDKKVQAHEMLEACVNDCQIFLGPKHPKTCTSMISLSNYYVRMGNFDAARVLGQDAATYLEENLGKNHPETIEAKGNLVHIAEGDNDYDLAESQARDLFTSYKHVFGETHLRTLDWADVLASMLVNSGKETEAAELYEWALTKKELVIGPNHTQTLLTVHNLANIRKIQGKSEEARDLFTRAYEGLSTTLGPKHSSALMSLSKLAIVHASLQEHETAERMAREAVAGFRELDNNDLDEDRSDKCGSSDKSIDEDSSIGAEERQNDSEETVSDSSLTLQAISILGKVLMYGDKNSEAELLHRSALRGFEIVYGPNAHDTLLSCVSLTSVLFEQGKYDEALKLAVRAETGLQALLGSGHPDSVVASTNIVSLKKKIG